MPNTSSAKKALRQDEKRSKRNLVVKKTYKVAVKTAKEAITKGESATDLIRTPQKTLAKAAKEGVIKKNTASRKISRLAKMAQKVAK